MDNSLDNSTFTSMPKWNMHHTTQDKSDLRYVPDSRYMIITGVSSTFLMNFLVLTVKKLYKAVLRDDDYELIVCNKVTGMYLKTTLGFIQSLACILPIVCACFVELNSSYCISFDFFSLDRIVLNFVESRGLENRKIRVKKTAEFWLKSILVLMSKG